MIVHVAFTAESTAWPFSSKSRDITMQQSNRMLLGRTQRTRSDLFVAWKVVSGEMSWYSIHLLYLRGRRAAGLGGVVRLLSHLWHRLAHTSPEVRWTLLWRASVRRLPERDRDLLPHTLSRWVEFDTPVFSHSCSYRGKGFKTSLLVVVIAVDGAWSVWGDWSPCTTTCGGGTSMRTRYCVEPVDGGAQCQGDFTEERICSNQSCPGNSESSSMQFTCILQNAAGANVMLCCPFWLPGDS